MHMVNTITMVVTRIRCTLLHRQNLNLTMAHTCLGDHFVCKLAHLLSPPF